MISVVYQIKCILDEILDSLEDLTDGLLNDLEPIFRPVIQQATDAACSSGLQLAGLCLLGLGLPV